MYVIEKEWVGGALFVGFRSSSTHSDLRFLLDKLKKSRRDFKRKKKP
jgi:hypothetical protein